MQVGEWLRPSCPHLRQAVVFDPSCRNPIDNWLNARHPTFMNFDRFAGFFAASAVCLTMAIVVWTGVVGPIWRATYTATPDQWLGFVGSLIGAVATVAAGLTALFAAYKTLSPMRAQLDQLIKQNDHILYDRMRKRAADLNEEIILIEQICGDCAVVNRTLEEFLRAGAGAGIGSSPEPFKEAVARLSPSATSRRLEAKCGVTVASNVFVRFDHQHYSRAVNEAYLEFAKRPAETDPSGGFEPPSSQRHSASATVDLASLARGNGT
jgi:hypothetical protein